MSALEARRLVNPVRGREWGVYRGNHLVAGNLTERDAKMFARALWRRMVRVYDADGVAQADEMGDAAAGDTRIFFERG